MMTGSSSPPLLAVVIPVYKGRYLERTLESFASQTDQRVRVYVSDDCSSEDLSSIVAPFRERLDLVYERFEANLGCKSLVGHFDRSIRMTAEPWVWLFSDDDIVAPDCVEAFLTRLALIEPTNALFRFQMSMIDENGTEMSVRTAYPVRETWTEYTQALMRQETWVVIQNIIFSRSVYLENGGFYDFPHGLWSDLLSWAKFAYQDGFETLPKGRVFYRRHAASVSAGFYFGSGDKRPLLESMRIMIIELRRLCSERFASDLIPRTVQLSFYCRQFRFLSRSLDSGELAFARKTMRELWPESLITCEVIFGWHRIIPRLRKIKTWLSL